MDRKPLSCQRFALSLLFFSIFSAIAAVLFATALIIWLSIVTHSYITALLIGGGVFTLLSLILYFSGMQRMLRVLHRHMVAVHMLVNLVSEGCNCVVRRLQPVLDWLKD